MQKPASKADSPPDPSSLDLLTAYGLRPGRKDQLRDPSLAPPGCRPARVVFESREHYRVITSEGERPARLAGRLRLDEGLPVVGDWVALAAAAPTSAADPGEELIRAILPRTTHLSRKEAGAVTREQVVAANVDTVFLVMGLDGDFNLRRLERFVVMVWESGADPVVVLTKGDLHPDPVAARLDAAGVAPGVPVHVVASIRGEGLEPLRAHLGPGLTVALLGSSGAGKSTLLNALVGSELMRTGAVREGDDRGRHTTTHRQLVLLPAADGDPRGGGLLVDNPGVREIQLWADDGALAEAFDDVDTLAAGCRFGDCRHEDEPGCAVRRAIDDGRLAAERLESWRGLERELRHLERKRDVANRRKEDRKLGKLYKRVQREKRARQRQR
ncbi:MAG: ribosome small subunit-dependent GTPase A [Holophagales bacterium]|nr:ribosome small subunit-dependent GTPase A [Holophagales bacterium]